MESAKGRYVEKESTLLSTESWTLLPQGALELDQSRGWAGDVIQRCESFLMETAIEELGAASTEQVHLWMQILLGVVFDGISETVLGAPAGVLPVGGSVAVTQYDLPRLQSAIELRCTDPQAQSFMKAMVAAALDPGTPFGSELVHFIATGYLLHAFLARRDSMDDRSRAGSLRGEEAFIDTNVLFRLLGALPHRQALLDALVIALREGITVVVHEETWQELERVLDNVPDESIRRVGIELSNGAPPMALERLAFTDDTHRMWLGRVDGSGGVRTWQEFRTEAIQLRTTLRAIGVVERTVSIPTVLEAARHIEFTKALRQELERRGRDRSEEAINHDACLLVDLARVRETRQDDNRPGQWPGALIITPDTFLNSTYRSANGPHGDYPVAVEAGQWTSLISTFADPASAEQIAELVSRNLSYETFLSRSVRLPREAALSLVRGLSGGSLSVTQLEDVQLTLDDLLATQPDVLDPAKAEKATSDVLALRAARMNEANKTHRLASRQEADRSARALEVQARVAAGIEARLAESTADGATLQQRLADTEAANDLLTDQAKQQETYARRWPPILATAVVLVLLGCVVMFFGHPLAGVGLLAAGFWFGLEGHAWAEAPNSGIRHLFRALLPLCLTIYDIFL